MPASLLTAGGRFLLPSLWAGEVGLTQVLGSCGHQGLGLLVRITDAAVSGGSLTSCVDQSPSLTSSAVTKDKPLNSFTWEEGFMMPTWNELPGPWL